MKIEKVKIQNEKSKNKLIKTGMLQSITDTNDNAINIVYILLLIIAEEADRLNLQ